MKMRELIVSLLLCHAASAATHSLKYFYTGSSQVPNFPEFVVVGLVDDVEILHYDSNTRRAEPKQDWMNKFTQDNPQYLESQTQALIGTQQTFKANIEIAKQRFNQTGGVHIVQWMYGCEWDDETGKVNGLYQQGYDGEDFLVFDLKTKTWTAPRQQALITKHKWDRDKALSAETENYLSQICPEWLKKYVNYGRSSLLRTELPSVSLLQKTPSSPVSCHATGFYPHRAVMFWRKDGEDLHEGVDQGETLLNPDGTFQMSVDLSSVKPEDLGKYECVFQLSGVKEDVVIKLDKSVIKTSEKSPPLIAIIIAAVAVLALVIGAIGFFIYRKKSAKRPPSPVSNPEVMEQLDPNAGEKELETSSGGSDESSAESLKSKTLEPDTLSCSSSGSSVESGDSYTPLMKERSNTVKKRGNSAL